MAILGANQFDRRKDQATFFNWCFVSIYSASIVGLTVIIYLEDNVGYRWGFGLAVITNLIATAIFLSGTCFYKYDKPQGSPFVGLARVIVAATWKRNLQISSESKDYYYGNDGVTGVEAAASSRSLRYKHYRVNYIHFQIL